nr:MAG TPA: hypothetical protein [Caudoviricetes sp.]
MHKPSTLQMLRTRYDRRAWLISERNRPILIYRKEGRVARADRAGTGFVDNSIVLKSGGKVGAGLMGAPPPCGFAGSHPLLRPRCR